jgi:Holin of 3TMs, for gene-transfer release
MATVAVSVLSALGGDKMLTGIASVINAIRGKDPAAAEALQKAVDEHDADFRLAGIELEKAQIAANVQMNDIAGQNIRAEQNSKVSAWARPGVVWAGTIVMLINYGILALLPPKWGMHPLEMPSIFWELWTVCVCGYTVARTAEKVTGGAGGTVMLPGLKLDSKGD